ncbi:MAG: Ppx/GppA phosphatase family protein [Novosphingobium sp.]|nr:Ppx/GppA phosphatase family protein [Novosphingobium sp.]
MSESVKTPGTPAKPATASEWLAAAIDIGATAIRMDLAEISSDGSIRTIESLRQGVPLGKDTFTQGTISQATIRECVKVLKGFRQVLQEYGITDPDRIRAVATSSVREAENRDTFLDRLYVATGINVRAIDEAEESRLTFMAVQNLVRTEPELKSGGALVVDVGGGSTELLLLENGHVTFSNSYRLGSLRMRQTLETHRAPTERVRTILGQHIQRMVEQIVRNVPAAGISTIVAMSGDARFAAAQLCPEGQEGPAARIDYKALGAFVEKLLPMTVEKLVSKYHITYQEAETAVPALLVDVQLARAFKVDRLMVPRASLRDGVLQEMALRGYWTPEFAGQVVYSAQALADKYNADRKHNRHVADVCLKLYDALKPEHQLSDRHRVLLEIAALLHEIGGFISSRSHHKHSMYLILHSDLFGLTREDMAIIALTARYHRRAAPKPTHEEYMALSRDDRIAVSKMSALLRVADALDRNHVQQATDLSFQKEADRFVIIVGNVEDLTIERLALKEKGGLFEEMYGMSVVLQEARIPAGGDPA